MTAEKIKHGKDPYEPTPEGFHIRVENTLRPCRRRRTPPCPGSPSAGGGAAALLLTLAAAAYAGSRLGVRIS